jgi:hypothetical protein
MMIFVYTFILVFLAMIMILGIGAYLADDRNEPEDPLSAGATASMCTTRLLGKEHALPEYLEDDFVIEQDLVYTYDSVNL